MKKLDATAAGFDEELRRFRRRGGEIPPQVLDTVQKILDRVSREGDAALFDLTRKFDGFPLDGTNLEFSHNERAEAAKGADTRTIEALEHA
ncbi:MAG: histidinol dehydrogenase, partial [Deltaproteobacteria bacterium]|nr:histidinol dehydrogenase [Deltaproteobacteria bacterium]